MEKRRILDFCVSPNVHNLGKSFGEINNFLFIEASGETHPHRMFVSLVKGEEGEEPTRQEKNSY